MDSIPFQLYQGRVVAFGVYGMPTLPRLSRRTALILAAFGLLAVLYLVGAIDLHSGLLLGAGPVVTERSKEHRRSWTKALTDARSVLDVHEEKRKTDTSLTAELPGDDQKRYDAFMADALRSRKAAENEETLAAEERDLSKPLDEPTRPDISDRSLDPVDEAELTPERRERRSPEYRARFRRFLQSRMNEADRRSLQMDSDTAGGYLVAPEEFMTRLIKNVDNIVHIRQLATVQQLGQAVSLGVPSLAADPDDFDWTTELQTGNEDSTMAFGKREFRPHPLAKRIKISKTLLRRSSMDPEGIVIQRLGYKLGVTQEKAYLTGSGFNRPLGVFVASDDGVPTSRDITAASTTAIAADDLISLKYALKPQYRMAPGLAWMFHRDAIARIAKLKDGNGQYLLQPGLSADIPDRISGKPFLESEYAPNTFTTGQYVGMLADWQWYWIVDALDMQMQRLTELYAETNQDGFIARYEGDGMPVLPEAFARLKLA